MSQMCIRDSLISIAATEDGQPRIDILDGVKAKNFNGCLRCRLGKLDGIRSSAFPADKMCIRDRLGVDMPTDISFFGCFCGFLYLFLRFFQITVTFVFGIFQQYVISFLSCFLMAACAS